MFDYDESDNSKQSYVDFDSWTGDRSVATLGTNAGSTAIPFQNWRTFKEAFAPELIKRAVQETGKVSNIVDPFGGSGTTALAAQFLGARPTTIEVNPYLADLIEAKIAHYDFDALVDAYARVRSDAFGQDIDPQIYMKDAPATFLEPGIKGRYLFSLSVARRFFSYRAAIEKLQNVSARRLFHVLLCGFSVAVSNAVVSGKGRRYRPNWQSRMNDAGDVDRAFEKAVLEAIRDLRHFENRRNREYSLLRGDARILIESIGEQDLSVFSPPYPNSFDYTDVYNIELWVGGYFKSGIDNRNLRETTLRSHVQIFRDMSYSTNGSTILADTITRLQDVRSMLWNKCIPEMVGAYFHDMAKVISGLKGALRVDGRVYMVVGDSKYAGVEIPVARILAEQMPQLGFEVILSEPFRSMRASPQQGGQSELAETLIVLRA